MNVISITTTNFKKLGSKTLNFSEGLNVLVGDNAVGKSTVLEAIEAALYGFSTLACKKEHIATWGQQQYGVELSFVKDGKSYIVKRSNNNASITCEGELAANGNTATTSAVVELLGINSKDFNFFVKSQQGETTGILNFGATELTRKVEDFGGIGRLDKLIKSARDNASMSKKLIESIGKPESLTKLESERSLLSNELSKLIAELEHLKGIQIEEPAKPLTDYKSLAKKLSTINELKSEIADVKSRIALLTEQINSTTSRIASFGEQDTSKLKAEVASYAELVKTLQAKAADAKEKVGVATKVKSLLEQINPLRSVTVDEDYYRELISKYEARVYKATTITLSILNSIEHRKAMIDSSQCKACGSVLHSVNKEAEILRITTLEARYNKLQKYVYDKTSYVSGLKKELMTSENAYEQLNKIHSFVHLNKCKTLKEEMEIAEAIESQLESAKLEYRSKKEELNKALSLVDEFEAEMSKLKRLKTSFAASATKVEELTGILNSTEPVTEAKLYEAKEADDNYNKQLIEFNKQKSQLEIDTVKVKSEISFITNQIKAIDSSIEKSKNTSAILSTHIFEFDGFTALAKQLSNSRSTYSKKLWDTLTSVASTIVSSSSNNLVSSIEYENGEVFFVQDSIKQPISNASGAQKAHIGTALRVAMCSTLYSGSSMLIFDEPTESMSEFQASLLVSNLANLGRQVIIITHRDKDQSLANNIIQLGE